MKAIVFKCIRAFMVAILAYMSLTAIDIVKCEASGSTTTVLTYATGHSYYWSTNPRGAWPVVASSANTDLGIKQVTAAGDSVANGYSCSSTPDNWTASWSVTWFDITGIDWENVTAARIKAYCGLNHNSFTNGNSPDYGWYTFRHSGTTSITVADCRIPGIENQYSDTATNYYGLITDLKDQTEITQGSIITWTFSADAIKYLVPDNNGRVYLAFCITNVIPNESTGAITAPTWQSGSNDAQITLNMLQGGNVATLELDQTPDGRARTPVLSSNAAATSAPAAPAVTAVNWITPKYMYADEKLQVDVAGTAGTRITLQLQSDKGTSLVSASDSIRTGGHFYWSPNIPGGYQGYIQVVETTYNVRSNFGYTLNPPDVDFPTDKITVQTTEYPQQKLEFKTYAVKANDLIFIFWNTNIDGSSAGELSDHRLQIWFNGTGDGGELIYDYTFTQIAALMENNAANNVMVNDRYLMFAMSNNEYTKYGTLIINLDKAASVANWGFYQPRIYKTATAVSLTNTLNSLFYIKEKINAIAFGLDKSAYPQLAKMYMTMHIDSGIGILEYYDNVRRYLINPSGTTYNVAGWETELDGNEVDFGSTLAPQQDGKWEVLVKIEGDDQSWEYEYRKEFTIGSASAGGSGDGSSFKEDATQLKESLDNTLDKAGLNNKPGKWIITLVIMVIMAVAFRKNKILVVVMPMMALGISLCIGWLDWWWIVLLALGAGVFAYKALFGGGLTGRA